MRGEREPPLRMIGRTKSVKFPDRSRQNAIAEFITRAPPAVPDLAQIIVAALLRAGQFRRKQAADAKKPGLHFKDIPAAELRRRRPQPGLLLGVVLHRPAVVFVAERAEQALPKRLFPAAVPGAGA